MVIFLVMRLGNGKLISKSQRPPANPFAYFGRFFAQPRLVTGWIFAVVRSCGWWVYVVYLPIYAVQNGSTDEFLKRVEATLAVFEREMEEQPRIVTLALHPHIIAVPHVAHYLEQALDLLAGRDDSIFVTSSVMGDWFGGASTPPADMIAGGSA